MTLYQAIQHEESRIEKKLNKLQDQLTRLRRASQALRVSENTATVTAVTMFQKPKRRHLSPEGRAAIIAAAKKRWRKYHRAA